MGRQHNSTDRQIAHRAGQLKIKRRCTCGRVLVGNAAWWSHTHTKDREPREGHAYAGRAT